MRYRIAKVTGLNSDLEASLAATFGEGENRLFAVLSLVCDDAFGRGRQLLSDASDFFFTEDGSVALKITELFKSSQEKLTDTEEYSLVFAAISGKALYVIGHGGVKVLLKRGDKFSTLLDEGSNQVMSGFLEEEDRVLISTQSLIDKLGGELENALNIPIETWDEEINTKLGEAMNLAGIIVESESEEEPVAIPRSGYEEPEMESESLSSRLKFKIPFGMPKLNLPFPQGGRVRLILAGLLIAVLIIGAGLKYKGIRDADNKAQFNQLISSAKTDYQDGTNLKTLNPAEATNKFKEAQINLDKALKIMPSDSEALSLKRNIEDQLNGANPTNTNFSEYLDLNLIKQGFSAKNISLSGKNVLLLDTNSKTLVSVDISKKSHTILAEGSKLGQATLSSINGSSALALSSDKGITQIDLSNQKASVSAKPSKDWGSIVDMVGFGGNIYLLDSKANQIWKYIAISGGYSDNRPYLTSDTKVNFDGALKMQIESSVYILKSGGEILRFTKGESDNFSLGGLPNPLKSAKSIFTSSEGDNLYILDSGNSSLVVVTKTGTFVTQYQGDKFKTASDFVVDEANKKVYLLDQNKLYTMDLKL